MKEQIIGIFTFGITFCGSSHNTIIDCFGFFLIEIYSAWLRKGLKLFMTFTNETVKYTFVSVLSCLLVWACIIATSITKYAYCVCVRIFPLKMFLPYLYKIVTDKLSCVMVSRCLKTSTEKKRFSLVTWVSTYHPTSLNLFFGIYKSKKSPNKLYGVTSFVLTIPLSKVVNESVTKNN